MQLGHAVGAWSLAGQYGNEVCFQFAVVERFSKGRLRHEYARGCLDRAVLRRYRGNLYDGTADVAGNKSQPAFGIERVARRAHDICIEALLGCAPPFEFSILQEWFAAEVA